jgi:uncharacterized protein YdhG (YjbR/CyaY superfamily)
MSPKKVPQESTRSAGKQVEGFTDEERAAMKERAQELMADKADGESAVLAKIAEMPDPDRAMGERIHAIIKASVPSLLPRTRYATFGFSDEANLDEGAMWPTAFALKELTAAEEARIAALVKKAAS